MSPRRYTEQDYQDDLRAVYSVISAMSVGLPERRLRQEVTSYSNLSAATGDQIADKYLATRGKVIPTKPIPPIRKELTMTTVQGMSVELTPDEASEVAAHKGGVDEYRGANESLRGQGITVAAYLKTWRRDHGLDGHLSPSLLSACDKMQKYLGAVRDPMNPLAHGLAG